MFNLDKIFSILREMNGVEKVFLLEDDILEELKEEESSVKATLDISVINKGFTDALERDYVLCIVKNSAFRPPPEPTVILSGEDGCLMGIEVFPHTLHLYEEREDVAWLSDGFVVFPNVIPKGREYFVMPPVSFPEINGELGCCNVLSCSPSPTSDKIIKDRFGLEDDPKKASILVAFDQA